MNSIQNAIILNDKYDDAVVIDSDTINRFWNDAEISSVDSNRSFGKITLYPCSDSDVAAPQETDESEPS